jgi:hypothetical protein
MTSNIDISNINTNYPVAGENNDTQGFRDNFSLIADNIEFAKNELNDLQANGLRADAENDLFGNVLKNATLRSSSFFYYDNGNTNEDLDIRFVNGQFQTVTVTEDIILRIIDWPSEANLSNILIAVKSDGEDRQLTIREFENQTLKFDDLFPENIIVSSSEDYDFFEIFSFDAGETLNVEYKGKYSNNFVDAKKFRNIEADDVQINGNLIVSGETSLTDINVPSQIELLDNVTTDNLQDKQIFRYNNHTGNWESSDQEKVVNYAVTIQESSTEVSQSRFFVDGTEITEFANFTLDVEKIYRFDISDSSNAQAPLRISTTPDTNSPASVIDYSDNVKIVGSAGEEGSYVEVKITEDTPSVLYFYGEQVFLNTSLIGGGEDGRISVGIKRKTGVFDTVITDVQGTVSDVSNHTTDDITEGSNNLYYTDSKVETKINEVVSQSYVNDLEVNANTLDGQSLTEFALLNSDNIFTSDVTIQGNLTLQDNTIISTAGNLLTINADETGTPTQNVGIVVERGIEENKSFFWNEADNLWTINEESIRARKFQGDLDGSVLAADSTLLVDAENGVIPYSVISEAPTSLSEFNNDIDYPTIIQNEIQNNGLPETTLNGSIDTQGNEIVNANLIGATGTLIGSIFADDSTAVLIGSTGEFVGVSKAQRLVMPNLSQAERDNLIPDLGETIYNITTGKIQSYVGDSGDSSTDWVDLH